MASFIAKQMLGSQLDSVKGALGDKKEDEGGSTKKEMDPEVEAALREAEERRQEKHRKMEEERENMRQGIRDKQYGIKKKEEPMEMEMPGSEGRVGRKRKSPGELAAEAAAAEEAQDSITSMLPEGMRDTANKMLEAPTKLASEAQEKCSLM
ncbi:complexin 1 [Cichlidogyrus casuarinus]|uniref:Complexin 1 n=1 Tax=Cichlidogyrus casuarinus TaxID=1844966 RepID=A0ABD2QEV6_9PLAT